MSLSEAKAINFIAEACDFELLLLLASFVTKLRLLIVNSIYNSKF